MPDADPTIPPAPGDRPPDPPPPPTGGDDHLERPGDGIGPYRLVSKLGEGGFGVVWLAERRSGYREKVALKVIKPGMDSKAVVARFEQERQALAVMNHPGIAKILDGGLTPRGRPFFVMELVRGEPITEYCDQKKLSIEERLALFAQACEAVQHAHLKSVVHRDLKPSNILAFDAEGGEPALKIIDFGVAKATGPAFTDKSIFTATGQMIGTPEYMSPEQADPTAADIDTRSDIYSLGVLLYELVAGATPFDGRDLRSKAYAEIQRILREVDPPSPSARLSTISTRDAELSGRIEKARGVRAADLARTLRRELEWIPLKAMRKEPRRRYQTALELAADVRAYLDGRPIAAAPESTSYRVGKYLKRHRGPAAAAAAVVVALVVGLVVAWTQKIRADGKAAEAIAAKETAEAERERADEKTREAEGQRTEALDAKSRAEELLSVIAIGSALDAARDANPEAVNQNLAIVDRIGRQDRFDARLARAMSDRSIAMADGHQTPTYCVDISPDGKMIASGGQDRAIRLWDRATGKVLANPLTGHEGSILCVKFSPDRRTLASGSHDGTIRRWDTITGTEIGEPLLGHGESIWSIAIDRAGSLLASGSGDRTIRLWSLQTGGQLLNPIRGHTEAVLSVDLSADGQYLASGSADDTVRLWSATTGQPIGNPLLGHESDVFSVAFSPDGKMLASAGDDGLIRLWEVPNGRAIGEPLDDGISYWLRSVAFSPDGRFLGAGNSEGTITLWNVSSRQQFGSMQFKRDSNIWDIAFSPDGTLLAGVDETAIVRLWSLGHARHMHQPILDHESEISTIALSPNGRVLASGHFDIRLWDTATGRALGARIRGHARCDPVIITALAFSRDGNILASSSHDDTIRLWDVATGRQHGEPLRAHQGYVDCVAFSPDLKTFVSGGGDGTIRLWNVATNHPVGEPLRGHEGNVESVAFSPDGRTLASGGWDNTIRLWDVASRQPIGEPLQGHGDSVNGLAFSPDGRTLASGGDDNTIRLWDVANRRQVRETMRGHTSEVLRIAFSPDGRVIATGSDDGNIRLWDISTGWPIGEPLRGHRGRVMGLEFDPNGRFLVSASQHDGAIRYWDAVPLRDRIGEDLRQSERMSRVRSSLATRIAHVGLGVHELAGLESEIRSDPRFAGDLLLPALMVVGEVDLEHQAARRAVREKINAAIDAKDWRTALSLLSGFQIEDFPQTISTFWNSVAWHGLTELPPDAPERDLPRLLAYAERAVEQSERRSGASLGTLARAHRELGDLAKAIEIQREAVAAARARLAAVTDEQSRASLGSSLAELEATLARYEREAAASAPAP